MTKQEAKVITDLKFDIETEALKTTDEETKQTLLGWLKTIEPEYIKAQKILARYNK